MRHRRDTMRLVFLGTGTPDFFSNSTYSEFHVRARRAGGRNRRYPSMLFIEPDCLIDFPGTGALQMRRAGIRRGIIHDLLVTHSHDDHFDAGSIAGEMKRAGGLRHVYGNEIVCRRLRRALEKEAPSAISSVHLLAPFQEVSVGRMTVIPLKANHCWVNDDGEPETALNFILRADGTSLLYLVDTRLMYQETHDFLRNFTYDAVVIDATFGHRAHETLKNTGHLNFHQATEIVETFERDGLLRPGARKILTHISTINVDVHEKTAPPLAKRGYALAYDGMKVTLRGRSSEKTQPVKRKAQWVWHPREENMRNFFLYARKKIHLASEPENASVACTCRNRYQLYVNGRFLGRGPSPCDPSRQYYDEYDITPFLKVGANVIAVLGYSFGENTESCISQTPKASGLFLKGEIRCKNGVGIQVTSDQTWRVKRSDSWAADVARLNPWIGYREVYDSGHEDEGWTDVEFDERMWLLPEIQRTASGPREMRLVAREIPFLQEKEIQAKSVVRIDPNLGSVKNKKAFVREEQGSAFADSRHPGSFPSVLLDFGGTVVGYPALEIGKNQGGVCILSYGESLDLRAYDRLILSGRPLKWSPFGRRAFRYLQLTFHNGPKPIEIRKIALKSVSYPVEERGKFECSDDTLNRVWKVARSTVQACMQDHFEDCPTREQALWMADLLVDSRAAYYAFGETRLTKKCLRQMSRIQHDEGWIPAVGPVQSKFLFPDFCAYWVMTLREYVGYSGDKNLLKETYPTLERLMKWFEKQEDSHHLIQGGDRKDWKCFIDWAPLDKKGEVTALQCIYYQALLDASALCGALGKKKESIYHGRKAEKVKEAVNERLWTDWNGVGAFVDCRTKTRISNRISRQTNMLALLFGVVDSARRNSIIECISGRPGVTGIKTPFMNAFAVEALFRLGREQQALELVRDYWGEMLKRGATTFWEEFDKDTPRSHTPVSLDDDYRVESLCHGWSGGPAYFLPAYVLGTVPESPGFRSFRVIPSVADLEWARGTVPTPYGNITLAWKKENRDSGFRLSLSFPEECRARVSLPAGTGKVAAEMNGKSVIPAREGSRALFDIAHGGRYELQVREKDQ